MSSNLTSAASSPKTLPPVATAMSWRVFLRLSPNPGALTAATWRPILSRLTTRVVKASPSMSSAMMIRGRLCWEKKKANQATWQIKWHIKNIWFKASVRLVTIVWSDSQGNDNIITQVDIGQFLSATSRSTRSMVHRCQRIISERVALAKTQAINCSSKCKF